MRVETFVSERETLCRDRMFKEMKISLNNTNSKWLKIGITPKAEYFETAVQISGDKSPKIMLTLDGFLYMLWQIRAIPYFKGVHTDVSVFD